MTPFKSFLFCINGCGRKPEFIHGMMGGENTAIVKTINRLYKHKNFRNLDKKSFVFNRIPFPSSKLF